MNKLLIFFLLSFSTRLYCEQRGTYYSELDKRETQYPYAMFYDDVTTVLQCGVKCINDNCCAQFLYDKISKQCIGVHNFERGVISFSQIPGLSDKTEMYRKGCGIGWTEFKGHWYFYGEKRVTWLEAKLECQNLCSYLVEIEDKEEADWLSKTFLKKGDCPTGIFKGCTAWTGGNDLDIEGQYVWDHSNTSMVFTNWYRNEPSILTPSQGLTSDCIDILRSGEWNDRSCSFLNAFICKK